MTDNDSTFKSDHRPLPGDTDEIGSGSPSGFGPAAPGAQPDADLKLDLLLPEDLPVEHLLTTSERSEMRDVLVNLLQALQLPDRRDSCKRLDELLLSLKEAEAHPASVGETGIPVNATQVDDFDGYFRVNRITTNKPAIGLVRGLLQTSRAVMSLFCRGEHLPQRQVQEQIAGFIGYTHLLARTFELGELS